MLIFRIDIFNDRLVPLISATDSLKFLLDQLHVQDIDLTKDMGRSERAWLGWFGEFIAATLGLSTQADVQHVINHLKELQLNATYSLSDLQHTKNFMAKIVESTNERFNCS